jgi:hypothetical protein
MIIYIWSVSGVGSNGDGGVSGAGGNGDNNINRTGGNKNSDVCDGGVCKD